MNILYRKINLFTTKEVTSDFKHLIFPDLHTFENIFTYVCKCLLVRIKKSFNTYLIQPQSNKQSFS